MKSLLVFVLLGVTCCLAKPRCSVEELAKCFERHAPRTTVQGQLRDDCRKIKCWLLMHDACGTGIFLGISGYDVFGEQLNTFPVKGYKKFVSNFCPRYEYVSWYIEMMNKYLENVRCIKNATKTEDVKKICGIELRPRDEYCRQIPDGMKCAVDYITKKCGNVAGEVYQVAALPALDPFDCLSS